MAGSEPTWRATSRGQSQPRERRRPCAARRSDRPTRRQSQRTGASAASPRRSRVFEAEGAESLVSREARFSGGVTVTAPTSAPRAEAIGRRRYPSP